MTITDYAKLSYYRRKHYERFKKFVLSRPLLLSCMECRGEGGFREIIDPEIGGPWFDCGWCEGTGYMTPKARGIWLTLKKQEKHRYELPSLQ